MSDNQLIQFYLNNSELFVNNDLMTGAVRSISWGIIKLLTYIADACKGLYDISFGLIDFTTWTNVNTFVDKYKPLFIAMLAVSLFALGIMLIMSNEKKPRIVQNICIAALCVTCSTLVFTELNNVTNSIKKGIDEMNVVSSSLGVYEILSDNVVDICQIDNVVGLKGLKYNQTTEGLPHPMFNKNLVNALEYNEVLDYNSERHRFNDPAAEDILTNRLVVISTTTEQYKIEEIYDGLLWTSTGNQFYYRYKMNFLPAFLELVALAIIYIACSFKCVRMIYELAFARLLGYLYAADISGGERIRKILVFIRDTYIGLLLTAVSIKIFYIFVAFVTAKSDDAMIEAFLIVFAALAVIDGPNLVEKLLGIDIGLNSAAGRMIAVFKFASSTGRDIRNTIGHSASNVLDGLKGKDSGNKGTNTFSNTMGRQTDNNQSNAASFMNSAESRSNSSVYGQNQSNMHNTERNGGTDNFSSASNNSSAFMDEGSSNVAGSGSYGEQAAETAGNVSDSSVRGSDFMNTDFMEGQSADFDTSSNASFNTGPEGKGFDNRSFMNDDLPTDAGDKAGSYSGFGNTNFIEQSEKSDGQLNKVSEAKEIPEQKIRPSETLSQHKDQTVKEKRTSEAVERVSDKWQKMMDDEMEIKRSPFRRSSSEYAGSLFDKGMNKKKKKGKGEL